MLAIALAPELAMGEDEAETLAKAYLDMQRHYTNHVISGKTMDTLRFAMVASTIYGGRIVRINMRRKADRSKAETKPSSPRVVSINRGREPVASVPRATNGAGLTMDVTGIMDGPIGMPDDAPGTEPIN